MATFIYRLFLVLRLGTNRLGLNEYHKTYRRLEGTRQEPVIWLGDGRTIGTRPEDLPRENMSVGGGSARQHEARFARYGGRPQERARESCGARTGEEAGARGGS